MNVLSLSRCGSSIIHSHLPNNKHSAEIEELGGDLTFGEIEPGMVTPGRPSEISFGVPGAVTPAGAGLETPVTPRTCFFD